MSNLIIRQELYALDHEYVPLFFVYTDMGKARLSYGDPLYTHGAGPCLNVVVHDTSRNIGALAHIPQASLDSSMELNRDQNFHNKRAMDTILRMASNLGNNYGDYEVWLGAGGTFTPDVGPLYNSSGEETAVRDRNIFLDRFAKTDLKIMLENHFPSVLDNRLPPGWGRYVAYDPGNIVYFPKEGIIYLLSGEDLRKVQENSVESKNCISIKCD